MWLSVTSSLLFVVLPSFVYEKKTLFPFTSRLSSLADSKTHEGKNFLSLSSSLGKGIFGRDDFLVWRGEGRFDGQIAARMLLPAHHIDKGWSSGWIPFRKPYRL